jgi:hypothetical protein
MLTDAQRIFVLVCLLLASVVSSTSKEDPISSESLISQARKAREIWTAGTPPITMRTEIQVPNSNNTSTPGQYTVSWVSPLHWREELRFANYERIRVHDAKGYWQTSGLGFQPQIAFQLDTLLDFKTVLKIQAKQVLGKAKSHDKNGVRQRCTDVNGTRGTERILCFDETTGDLLSVEYLRLESQNPPAISRIEYSSFRNVGEKRVPFETHAFRDDKVVATIKVLEIAPTTEEKPSLFVAPANSEFWAQCDDMQAPELVRIVQPKNIASIRDQGRTVFYAVIEADGTLSHLTVIQRSTPALESAIADALRQSRFKPAACASTPIRVETSIPIDVGRYSR